MPDWFYQPVYKPVVMRVLSAESARRLTLYAMRLQSKSLIGRKIFDILSRTFPPITIPDDVRVEVFGLSFPTPIGLAPNIDIEANALSLWPMLGLGFVQVGNIEVNEVPSSLSTEPRLMCEFHSIVTGTQAGSPAAAVVAAKMQNLTERIAPIGVSLRAKNAIEAIAILESSADFFSIPALVALDLDYLAELRSTTKKPILIRLSICADVQKLEQAIENAVSAGFDGCIVMDGEETNLVADGLIHGAHLRTTALDWVSRIVKRYGDTFPVIGSGGIMSPHDAIAFLEAGAKLVQLYEGLIYAGPGLPRRIIWEMRHPKKQQNNVEHEVTLQQIENTNNMAYAALGWKLVLFVGFLLIMGGFLGIAGGFLFKLLPYELSYLQMTIPELQSYYDGRLAGFILHDRVIYHGALVSYGILYSWLAWFPLRPSRGEAWAWWTLLISGTVGATSTYISYVYSDYFDVWYGSISFILIGIYYVGLILSYRTLKHPRHPLSILKAGSQAWLFSPAGLGRLYLMFWATTTALGGFLIFGTGMSRIFVPEDLAFMQTTPEAIQAINSNLVPFIAHDRLGFGITLFAIGIAALTLVWKGIQPGSKSVLIALMLAYIVNNITSIWIHPIVGYNSWSHLLPFLAKDTAFLLAIFYLYHPVTKVEQPTTAFHDL